MREPIVYISKTNTAVADHPEMIGTTKTLADQMRAELEDKLTGVTGKEVRGKVYIKIQIKIYISWYWQDFLTLVANIISAKSIK